jgi:trehalose/maltose hydrolase-like predicted phosphorylase
VFSWVYSRSNRRGSWNRFKKALVSDFADVQGGTTKEGIHLGAMAGTIDLIQRCYTGLEIRNDILVLNPRLPAGIREINMNLCLRSHWFNFKIRCNSLKIVFRRGWSEPVEINVQGKKKIFRKNGSAEFKLT